MKVVRWGELFAGVFYVVCLTAVIKSRNALLRVVGDAILQVCSFKGTWSRNSYVPALHDAYMLKDGLSSEIKQSETRVRACYYY